MTVQLDPRKAVVNAYAQWHEWHAEQEQLLVGAGRYDDAQPHHEAAVALLFAMDAEERKPEPVKDAPECAFCGDAYCLAGGY